LGAIVAVVVLAIFALITPTVLFLSIKQIRKLRKEFLVLE
jgi:hypothetical protein